MDSINQQQPEENRKDLVGQEAGEKIRELVEKANSCFFCTRITSKEPLKTRPMAVQKVDDHGNFWFLSASDSEKNEDIRIDPYVQLLFQGSQYSDFLSLYGIASITKNKEIIKGLWEPMLKAWFTEGEDDPRITAIKFEAKEGYYWDNKHGNAVAVVKTMIGAMLGKTLDDSIEGRLVNP